MNGGKMNVAFLLSKDSRLVSKVPSQRMIKFKEPTQYHVSWFTYKQNNKFVFCQNTKTFKLGLSVQYVFIYKTKRFHLFLTYSVLERNFFCKSNSRALIIS